MSNPAPTSTTRARTRTRSAPLQSSLARITAKVMDGETRTFHEATATFIGAHHFPTGIPLDIYICSHPAVNEGIPFVEVGGLRGATLIELSQRNRVRAIWQNGWWVEIQLASFHHLVELATVAYGKTLPDDLTTLVVTTPVTVLKKESGS